MVTEQVCSCCAFCLLIYLIRNRTCQTKMQNCNNNWTCFNDWNDSYSYCRADLFIQSQLQLTGCQDAATMQFTFVSEGDAAGAEITITGLAVESPCNTICESGSRGLAHLIHMPAVPLRMLQLLQYICCNAHIYKMQAAGPNTLTYAA